MLQKLSEEIAECYAHASECRERAKPILDAATKKNFLEMEQRWLSLAHRYEIAERLAINNPVSRDDRTDHIGGTALVPGLQSPSGRVEPAKRGADWSFPSSLRPRTTLVHEGHRLRTAHVAGLQSFEPEACALDQRGNCTVEMAPAANTPPYRCQPILPPHHVRIGRATMLNEQEVPTRLERATHFKERTVDVRNGA